MYVTQHRRPVVIACAALLAAGLAGGCSDLNRTAVGPVDHLTTRGRVIQVNNPVVKGCHRFGPAGASAVQNGSLVDLIAYPTLNCSGDSSDYIATTLMDTVSPGTPPWRSYRFVH
ncbi:hypothetical protein [Streptomyces fuscigenes]|uniref:hypothetical protein n=1 Tax=Streptomyces fuscigenes TaxID=1528880 RepID=UPI001F3ECAEC|nr:hypothetical protein [Streptomyces fuscigenes]MCF3963310.1 hypothetical protein [Streptomyces fuscigenes]